MTVVEARGLSKDFGGVLAVDDLSFSVDSGEVVGLLGANGAGKTTTMRMLLGLLAPDAGVVTVAGAPAGEVDRALVGYLPQGLGLYPDLTVAENIAFATAAFGVPAPSLETGLAELSDRRVGDLSLGLRRRVAFIIANSHHPRVLILDEPTSGVGPLGRAWLWESIRDTASDGSAVVVSTHYMDEAEECDRVILMAHGRQVAAGSVRDVIGGASVVEVGDHLSQAVIDEIAAGGGTVLLTRSGSRIVGLGLHTVREMVGDEAPLTEAPATFEEAFVALAR
jgi:ABC-2 type transport system ATP-binding protein/ribosome-dependent ATPase